jgi:hypothetical protein
VIEGRIAEATTAVGSTLWSRPIAVITVCARSSTERRDVASMPSMSIGLPKVTNARERYPTA